MNALHTPTYTAKTLVVATAHISGATAKLLNALIGGVYQSEVEIDLDAFPVKVYDMGYGWCMHTAGIEPNEIATIAADAPELAKLIEVAQQNGFDRLEIDRDGEELPAELGCITYEW